MKHLFSLIILGAALALLTPPAPAQDYSSPWGTAELALSTNEVGASTDATVTSAALRLRGNQGCAFLPAFTGGTNGQANCTSMDVTFRFQVSHDSNTWTTTTPITYTVAAVSNQAVRGFVAVDPAGTSGVRNVRWIRLASINNANTNNVIRAITLRHSSFSP